LKSAFKEYIQFSWQNFVEKVKAKKITLGTLRTNVPHPFGKEKNVHFFRRWINSCEYGTEPFSKRRLDQ